MMTPTLKLVRKVARRLYPDRRIEFNQNESGLFLYVNLGKSRSILACGVNPTRLLLNLREIAEMNKIYELCVK